MAGKSKKSKSSRNKHQRKKQRKMIENSKEFNIESATKRFENVELE